MGYRYQPHPHLAARAGSGPVKVTDQYMADAGQWVTRFNARLALRVTRLVGSMWCAYVFGLFDLLSLPAAAAQVSTLVAWVAQTFLQLVLLSIIMVGQNVQALASDKRAEQTFNDVEAILHELSQMQAHMRAQDRLMTSPASPEHMTEP